MGEEKQVVSLLQSKKQVNTVQKTVDKLHTLHNVYGTQLPTLKEYLPKNSSVMVKRDTSMTSLI